MEEMRYRHSRILFDEWVRFDKKDNALFKSKRVHVHVRNHMYMSCTHTCTVRTHTLSHC